MPRPSYYQAIGNPVQTERLPDGPLQLQFAHTSDQSSANTSFSLTILRNLYLVVFICLAGEWISVAFRVMFPLNILLVIVIALVRLVVGMAVGLLAGYAGGTFQRIVDGLIRVALLFPVLVVALAVIAFVVAQRTPVIHYVIVVAPRRVEH